MTINNNISTQYSYTSSMTEPVRKYPLSIDSRSKERSTPQIMISPINGNIWELNFYKPAYELDSKTGEWKSLESIFGEYARRLRPINARDSIENNLAWITYDDGLLFYDIQTGKITDFKRDALYGNNIIEVIRPEKDVIWLGAAGGLIYIDRKDKSIHEIKGLKEVWIRSIDREGDRLWINGTYIYYPSSGKIENIMERKGWPINNVTLFKMFDDIKVFASLHDNDPVVIMDNKEDVIDTLEDMPKLCIFQDKDKYIWFVGNKFIRYDMRQKTAEIKYESDQGYYDCYDSGKYIYFHSANKFGRFDKGTGSIVAYPDAIALKYIVADNFFWIAGPDSITKLVKHNNDALFRPFSEIKNIEQRIYDLTGSLYDEKDVVKKIKNTAEYLVLSETYKDKTIIIQSNYNLIHGLKAKKEEFETIKEFMESTKVLLEKEIGYYMLATSPLLAGDIDTAFKYYNLLIKEFPNGKTLSWFSPSDRDLLELATKQFNDINENKGLHEDERLWRLGNLYFDVFRVSWNEGEVGYDMRYPFSFFEELISKYPNSAWADDAEFKILSYNEGIVHEGGDISLSCVNAYESFLESYPNSEFSPQVKLSIGDHYVWYWGSPQGSNANFGLREYLEKAHVYYSDVSKSHKGTDYAKQALEKIEQVDTLLDKHAWSLKIGSDKENYSLGENISINIILENMRDKKREISVRKERPNFAISIRRLELGTDNSWYKADDRSYEVPFIKDVLLQDDGNEHTKVIDEKGGTYSERQVINHLSKRYRENRDRYGKFKIDKAGEYRVTAYYNDDKSDAEIKSNEISFTVK